MRTGYVALRNSQCTPNRTMMNGAYGFRGDPSGCPHESRRRTDVWLSTLLDGCQQPVVSQGTEVRPPPNTGITAENRRPSYGAGATATSPLTAAGSIPYVPSPSINPHQPAPVERHEHPFPETLRRGLLHRPQSGEQGRLFIAVICAGADETVFVVRSVPFIQPPYPLIDSLDKGLGTAACNLKPVFLQSRARDGSKRPEVGIFGCRVWCGT